MTELTDVTLVQRCLAGDAEAFSMLVKKYESAVYGFCYHKVGNFADAQDLAQEAFVQAYLDLPQLRDATKFSHWLYRIASNACTTWLRRQGRKRKLQTIPLDDALKEYGDFIDEKALPPHDAVEYKELRASVASAISALSEKNRLAVTLYYIDGLSYEEIADFLDVPQSTVKSRLNKARKQLKEEFIKMVASDLQEHPLPDDFTEKIMREALDKAKEAHDKKEYREVVNQCDIALEALKKLPDDVEHKKIKAEALGLKGHAIHFPLGFKEALQYYEQVLAIKKETGSKAEYASYLNYIGLEYSNADEEEKAIEAHEKALKIFEEIDDKHGQAESLTWLGSKYFFEGDGDKSLSCFKKAMPLYIASQTGKDMMAAVCHAAIQLIEEVKNTPGLAATICPCANCVILKREPDGVVRCGQPGFGKYSVDENEVKLNVSLFHAVSQMNPMLDFTRKVGDTWSQEVFSYTFDPLVATATFESDSETVEVIAGKFADCWKIKVVTVQPKTEATDERHQRQINLNKINCGTREMWYAPSVGLVKYKADQESGMKATIELAKYSIQNGDGDYFPLTIGNWWEYHPVGIDERYVTKDRFEVIDKEENTYFISHYQYAYFTGSEEERRQLQ
jgi:RNA polymerase sigma-70 factor (ECF subfamily)